MDGSWREDNADWDSHIRKQLGVEVEYISPDRHEQAGGAERACGMIECITKSLLMQNNLGPDWWTRVANDAAFLVNRFPPVSSDSSVSLDGDRFRPLELFTDGKYSRSQIDREISYYVPIGTPCLVHDTKAKGSTLGPKVRWGIACGNRREIGVD